MMAACRIQFSSPGAILGIVLVLGSLASESGAEVRVVEMEGILHAVAGSACPPDGDLVREDFITADLADYQALAQADTASACGAATGLATLTTGIGGDSITAVLTVATFLENHRTSSGSSYFTLEFEVTVPTEYTLTAVGTSSWSLDPGAMGLGLGLRGIHDIQQSNPDFSEEWTGVLAPGRYFLDGSCSSSRAGYDIGGSWIFENGQAEIIGSVSLTFTDSEVVPVEGISLGSLKARYR